VRSRTTSGLYLYVDAACSPPYLASVGPFRLPMRCRPFKTHWYIHQEWLSLNTWGSCVGPANVTAEEERRETQSIYTCDGIFGRNTDKCSVEESKGSSAEEPFVRAPRARFCHQRLSNLCRRSCLKCGLLPGAQSRMKNLFHKLWSAFGNGSREAGTQKYTNSIVSFRK
jgi:hypothetical protein